MHMLLHSIEYTSLQYWLMLILVSPNNETITIRTWYIKGTFIVLYCIVTYYTVPYDFEICCCLMTPGLNTMVSCRPCSFLDFQNHQVSHQVTWAVSLVIVDCYFLISPRGLCRYVLVNMHTLSLPRVLCLMNTINCGSCHHVQ